jgi:hypothetical protein
MAARVLFIGNSFTARNDLPGMLAALAADALEPLRVETQLIHAGGASLRRHWNAGIAQRAIRDQRWDHVVLQEQSTLPVKNAARYHESVRLFAPLIEEHGARTALYLNWARQGEPQAPLSQAVTAIAQEIGATVVPAGPAWMRALRSDPGLVLYASDGSHPTPAGSYLAACMFLARLFDREPCGFAVARRLGIAEATAAGLHAAALNEDRLSGTLERAPPTAGARGDYA